MATLRRHPLYRASVAVALVALLILIGSLSSRLWSSYRYRSPGTTDFIQYWSASRVLLSGQNPYDQKQLCRVEREVGAPKDWCVLMWNPPWLLLWLWPVLMLPFRVSALVWLAINTALVFVGAELVRRSMQSRAPPWVLVASVLLFAPTYFVLSHGQTSTILFVGVAGFLHAARRGQLARAGAFLSLVTIKPHVLYLVGIAVLWWVVAGRRWRVLLGAALVLVPSVAALTLAWPDWLSAYLGALEQPPLYWRAPVAGSLLRSIFDHELRWLQFLPSVMTAAGLLAWLIQRRPMIAWDQLLGPLLLLSVPTAAYGWSFDQLVLLVPLLTLVSWVARWQREQRLRALVAIVTWLVVVAIQLILSRLRVEEFYQLWMPWALGALFLFVRPMEKAAAPL